MSDMSSTADWFVSTTPATRLDFGAGATDYLASKDGRITCGAPLDRSCFPDVAYSCPACPAAIPAPYDFWPHLEVLVLCGLLALSKWKHEKTRRRLRVLQHVVAGRTW